MTIYFGNYPQGENGEIQPIEWIVLENDGTTALLISKYAIAREQYHSEYENITWEKCDLRNWLNTTFIATAFTKEEQNQIVVSDVTADINPEYKKAIQGNDTKDKIFLLSANEANKYFSNDIQIVTKGTPYSYNRLAFKGDNGNCMWWLRTSGNYGHSAVLVHYDGSVCYGGIFVSSCLIAVRPALRINL